MIMSTIERLTITMPAEMVATVRAAVDAGAYASTSEIVREALRDWTGKRTEDARALSELRAAIAEGDEGEAIPAEEVFAEMRALIAERRASRA
jgi:antitoxin ParD1/3/4